MTFDIQIDPIEKNLIRENHLQLIKQISKNKNTPIFYTDGAYDQKSKISAASVMLYHNTKTAYKTWNLGIGMSIKNAELYVIKKTVEWLKI